MAAPLPGAGIQWQLTQEGAGFWGAMAWAAGGRTLYYVDASGRLWAIDVSVRNGARFGRPRLVAGAPAVVAGVDGASDGRLVLMAGSDKGPVPLTLVTGWQALIQESR